MLLSRRIVLLVGWAWMASFFDCAHANQQMPVNMRAAAFFGRLRLADALALSNTPTSAKTRSDKAAKPSPEEVLAWLKEGNERFVTQKMKHPHSDEARRVLAATESQADHALATILSCSDSRVPVELIFDAGIMDLFVIRVAGNVCDTDEIGSIEYGVAHVKTPLLVIMGHTQCGAVTAVYESHKGHGHSLEENIPPLVENIMPAVKKATSQTTSSDPQEVISRCIEENVWQSVTDLLTHSPATRRMFQEGKIKIMAAIYDIGSGKVHWLDPQTPQAILQSMSSRSTAPSETPEPKPPSDSH